LLTTLAKLLFHHGSHEEDDPVAIMRAVNNDFRSIFGARSFMTAMCVALDPVSGRASVVGAGHPPLLVARGDGSTESIPSSAPPLGLLERFQFTATEVYLREGDAFFLYTDGLHGGRHINPRDASARLAHLLQPVNGSAEMLLARVMRNVMLHEGNVRPDDVAAVVVQRKR
jgi:serine phosphatase RsbU (regulator of sigma subunit)